MDDIRTMDDVEVIDWMRERISTAIYGLSVEQLQKAVMILADIDHCLKELRKTLGD